MEALWVVEIVLAQAGGIVVFLVFADVCCEKWEDGTLHGTGLAEDTACDMPEGIDGLGVGGVFW